jgi:hypothetical protein
MRHIFLIAAGDALICLVGCVSPRQTAISEAVGPAPTDDDTLRGESALQVYSAREKVPVDLNEDEFMQNNDFGRGDFFDKGAHTDYSIFSQNGRLLEQVHNARGPNDPQPSVVPLAPGKYKIKVEVRDYGLVTIPVVIKPGKVTEVNLQRGRQPVEASAPGNELVVLGDSRVVGWKATATTAPNGQ